ncbi:MAG: DUF951 domain-containing protein [Caldilineaceae bacterium]
MEISEKLYIGDVVEMRKPHPCGGSVWEIVRVGADIGLVCTTCGRRILISRRKFAQRTKAFVRRGAPGMPEEGQP